MSDVLGGGPPAEVPVGARRRPGVRWWIVRILFAVVAGLAIGIAIDVARFGGPEGWLIRRGLPPPYAPTGATLEIDGIRTYIDCRGRGNPTVILESGLGTGAAGWGFVPERVATRTRVCTWDRPGIGNSEPMGRHTAADLAAHLRATLAAAGETGPFVVVGHSLGGVYARVFAAAYRDEIAGVALVDPYTPDILPVVHVAVDPDLRDQWLADIDATNRYVAAVEDLDWEAIERELAAASIEGIPLELVFIDQRLRWGGLFEPWQDELVATWRSLLAALSTDQRLTIAEDSGHMIQWDRPDVVVEAIERLL